MAWMRYQPQGLTRLNRDCRLLDGALAIVSGTDAVNLVDGTPLVSVGTRPARRIVDQGIAESFKRTHYLATPLLPAIGLDPYVEFWVGYPNATKNASGNGTEAGFLVGSSNNSTGIAQYLGSRGNGAPGSTWGAVIRPADWGKTISGSEVLTPDVLCALVVVRRPDRVELWRDGVLKTTYVVDAEAVGASKFLIGTFIDSTYWRAASDMVLCGRIRGAWTSEDVKNFSVNPWQIFESSIGEADDARLTVSVGYVDTYGASTSSSNVTAVTRAVTEAYGTSAGITTAQAGAQLLTSVTGNSNAAAASSATAYSVFEVSGGAAGSASSGGVSVSLLNTTANSQAGASSQAVVISVSNATGQASASATVTGNAACVWKVIGNSNGSSTVAAETYQEAGGRIVFDTQGASYGSAATESSAQTVSITAGRAEGVASSTAIGQALIKAIGSSLAYSSASANGISVISTTGEAVGNSDAKSVTIVIHEAVAISVSASEVKAVTNFVVNTIGESKGFAKVAGVTEGGAHYLAAGDKYNITLVFSKYVMEYNGKHFDINKT